MIANAAGDWIVVKLKDPEANKKAGSVVAC